MQDTAALKSALSGREGSGRFFVLIFNVFDYNSDVDDGIESFDANAHLIAAAPELFNFVKNLSLATYEEQIEMIENEAKGLINKAEGNPTP